MTRRDFQLIAESLKKTRPAHYTERLNSIPEGELAWKRAECSVWNCVCKTIANDLSGTNPRFDRSRFLDACGVKE